MKVDPEYVGDGLCCIKGCNQLIRAAMLCHRHYMALWKYGHPLGTSNRRNDTTPRVYRPKMREKWTWHGMLDRCHNPDAPNFKDYGARGISVCGRWRDSFEAFYEDMGPKPAGHSIERVNFQGNYEPGNCRWATILDQNRNKRDVVLTASIVADAKKRHAAGESVARLAREAGVKYHTMYQAIRGKSWKEIEAA